MCFGFNLTFCAMVTASPLMLTSWIAAATSALRHRDDGRKQRVQKLRRTSHLICDGMGQRDERPSRLGSSLCERVVPEGKEPMWQ